ncbi:hypothetical protein HZS_1218 [Henneguya salminicola]|nr:hypothetical protein HZS_1218 [Henneguya salminicola]
MGIKNIGCATGGISPILIHAATNGQNRSYLVSVTIKRVLFYKLYDGPIKNTEIEDFYTTNMADVPKNSVIIMNHARIHSSNIFTILLRIKTL